jgi:hypothetical protein
MDSQYITLEVDVEEDDIEDINLRKSREEDNAGTHYIGEEMEKI